MRNVHKFFAMVVIMVAVGGCASTGNAPTTTIERGIQPLACNQPVMSLHEETPAQQVDGSIAIQASILVPRCERAVRVQMQPANVLINIGGNAHFDRTEQDVYRLVGDETATLTLTITNQSSRVFRSRGSLWEATIDGVTVPVRPSGLLTLTILPRSAQDVTVRGIRLTGDADNTNVYEFSLHDVPTEFDEAGETTRRGSFLWRFVLDTERNEVGPAVTRRCRVTMAADARPRANYFVTSRTADAISCPEA